MRKCFFKSISSCWASACRRATAWLGAVAQLLLREPTFPSDVRILLPNRSLTLTIVPIRFRRGLGDLCIDYRQHTFL
jgi:hypothetical protein